MLKASLEIGVKEEGANSGKRVRAYLASCGLGEGAPWCAAFVHFNFRQCSRILQPKADFARAAHWATKGEVYSKARSRAQRGEWQRVSMNGDAFTLYYAGLKRIGHVGLITGEEEDYLLTVEGNTNSGGDRDGEGVYKRKRLKAGIHTVNRWWKYVGDESPTNGRRWCKDWEHGRR